MKIAIIGAGSVGTNLHHAFALKGLHTELIHARPLTAPLSPCYNDQMVNAQMVNAFDLYIYTVADNALREVIATIHAPKALHVHTSGSMPIEVFGNDKPHAAVMYFFQSFSREILIDNWSNIPCFIEGKNIDDIAAVYSLAQNLTNRIYEANQHDRERLHIAGIFANNYTNLMYRIAEHILKDTQIPFEALLPLIDQTAAKVHSIKPSDAQTGPAQRGDTEVINHHLSILHSPFSILNSPFTPEALASLYQLLAELIAKGQNHPNPTN